ncbi:MAG: TolB family protein, partial [Gemmatimonadales bacterium]
DFESTPFPGTERPWHPRFSPSGEWIAFLSFDTTTGRRSLNRVALDGSPAITICDLTHDTFWSLIWLSEDTLLLSRRAGVENSSATVSVDSGALEYVEFKTEGLGDYQGLYPSSLLPGGTSALGTAWRVIGTQTHGDAVLISLEDWSCRKILDNAITPTYSASGHLLLERDQVLLAAPFDADAGKVTGRVMPLISGVRDFDIADSGVLVYHPTTGSPKNRRLMTIDAKGNIQPLSPVERPFAEDLSISADGRWLGVGTRGDRELPRIWLYGLQTGLIRPLTPADEVCFGPRFSPDGRYVSYTRWDSEKPDIMVAPVDSSEEAREIFSFQLSAGWWSPDCWTADGQAILITRYKNAENDRDIMRLDLDFDALGGPAVADQVALQPKPVLTSAAREFAARVSPNGKWLAYYSNETGEESVHIRSYDTESGAVGSSRLVTTEPGAHGLWWSHDGSKIYFLDKDEHLLAVTVTAEPELTLSEPVTVLNAGELRMAFKRMIPLPDGERFVFIQKGEEEKEKEQVIKYRADRPE